MDFWKETNWFAVQTKPCQETLAATRVAQLDVEVFFPKTRQEQRLRGTERAIVKPLFPGYFFARFCPVLSFDAVRFAVGVVRVVGSQCFPIPVEPEVIAGLQRRLATDGFFPLERRSFQFGDKVIIQEGPLAGWMARIECERDDHRRVAILLQGLHHARVLIEKELLSLAEDAL